MCGLHLARIMIALNLTHDEAVFLVEQLRRHLQNVENELVHTDVHRMQHELAMELERLRALEARLEASISVERERLRASVPFAP